uniref:Craniofacial development protein 2 n=1 Tax=Cacopsylla melanoneura TaxID=428564 RepID=A0A8D8YQU9_9HEMI
MMESSRTKYSGDKIAFQSDLRVKAVRGDSNMDEYQSTTHTETGQNQTRSMENKNVKKDKETDLRIGTWNVQTLAQCGKLENLKIEMKRMKMNLVGIGEMRWKEKGDIWTGDYRLIHTGSTNGQEGVGLLLDKKLGKLVDSYLQFNTRIIMVRLKTKPTPTVVIQVYMPTSAADDETIETMYENIEETMKYVKGDENLIIMGDWNAVVGEEQNDVVGRFGLGRRNVRGERLIEFCQKHKLILTNTFFKHHKRRRYTWKMPGDIARYQIDFIMVKQRFRNQVKDSRSYPAADVGSDHNLVMMKCNLKFKKLEKKKSNLKKWNVTSLKNQQIQERYKRETDQELEDKNDIEAKWKDIKQTLEKKAEEIVGYKRNDIKKPWITEEIVNLIEERRQAKKDHSENGRQTYSRLKCQIINKCRKAKEMWIEEGCQEVEASMALGKIDIAYKTIKKNFEEVKPTVKNIRNKDEEILIEDGKIADRWKEYLENLYRSYNENVELGIPAASEENNLGDPILRSEFDLAVKLMKNNKTPGVDNINSELIKYAGEKLQDEIYNLTSTIYNTGTVPKDFTQSNIVTLPKTAGADKCENFRTLSLIRTPCFKNSNQNY